MIFIKKLATTTAVTLALSGYASAQGTLDAASTGGAVGASRSVVNSVPSVLNRVPSAVNAPSAVDAASSAVETAAGRRSRLNAGSTADTALPRR
jgi:hypothetical protein